MRGGQAARGRRIVRASYQETGSGRPPSKADRSRRSLPRLRVGSEFPRPLAVLPATIDRVPPRLRRDAQASRQRQRRRVLPIAHPREAAEIALFDGPAP